MAMAGAWVCPHLELRAQVPPEELEFRGDPDNRKDVMANRKRIQARPPRVPVPHAAPPGPAPAERPPARCTGRGRRLRPARPRP
jgi:hypothetical protein